MGETLNAAYSIRQQPLDRRKPARGHRLGGTTRALAASAGAMFIALVLLCAAPPSALADESGTDEEKTSTPTVSIEVAEEDADGALSWGGAADAQAGEWASWRSDGTLPSDWDDFDSYCYAFNLTPDAALEVDESTVAVEVLDAEGEPLADLTDEAAVSYEDGLLVVSFEDLKASISDAASLSGLSILASDDDASDAGAAAAVDSDCTVRVSYEARLLPESAQAGSDGAAETWVQLEYSDSTSDLSSTGTSVEDVAALYTWALSITKADADSGEGLSGAVFCIQNAEGRYVDADGALTEEAVGLETDEAGLIGLSGLDAGDYLVTEVAAPEGYEDIGSFSLTITSELEDEVALSASVEGEGVQVTGIDAGSGVVSLLVSDELSAAAAGGSGEEDESGATGVAVADEGGTGDSSDDSGGTGSALSSLLSQTGDVLGPLIGALLIFAAAAIVVMALRRRRDGGTGE